MLRDPAAGLTWLDMNPDDFMYWQSTTSAMKIGAKEYRFSKSFRAVFDTGTSLMIIPGCKSLCSLTLSQL
jgi:hypothetical protein